MVAHGNPADHRGVEDRLLLARRALQARWPAHAALAAAELPGLHERNLAARPGVVVRVDSFLSSRNTGDPAEAYPPMYETRLAVEPLRRPGHVRVRAETFGPEVSGFRFDLGGQVHHRRDGLVTALPPGRHRLTAVAEHVSGRVGPAAVLELEYRSDEQWPKSLEVDEVAQGRLPDVPVDLRLERWAHPDIAAIRGELGAAERTAGAGGDLDRALALRDWIKGLWAHAVARSSPPYNGRVIIDRALRGVDTFICMHYSVALVHACAAIGIPARVVNLHRGVAAEPTYELGTEALVDPPIDEHVTAEIWSADLAKWVMVDTDFACHYERDGVGQSALEIHEALLAGALDELRVRKGPGARAYDEFGEDFYPCVLPTYYRHVSVLMRSDFVSDPDGPVPVLHLTDERTPPILWHDGDDLRLHAHFMGPMVVAKLATDRTGVLTDGSDATAWASSDGLAPHHVEIEFPAPVDVRRVALVWPEVAGAFATSTRYRVDVRAGSGQWTEGLTVDSQYERAWSVHDLAADGVDAIRVVQQPGGGAPATPNRLWLSQVEVTGDEAPSRAARRT